MSSCDRSLTYDPCIARPFRATPAHSKTASGRSSATQSQTPRSGTAERFAPTAPGPTHWRRCSTVKVRSRRWIPASLPISTTGNPTRGRCSSAPGLRRSALRQAWVRSQSGTGPNSSARSGEPSRRPPASPFAVRSRPMSLHRHCGSVRTSWHSLGTSCGIAGSSADCSVSLKCTAASPCVPRPFAPLRAKRSSHFSTS